VAIRVKSRWANKDRKHSALEAASALAFIAWRIAGNMVLNLENEGFQTETNVQRLRVMSEPLAFLAHITDRLVADTMSPEQRQTFITAYALKLADYMQENMDDLAGADKDYRKVFIDVLNERMGDYAEFSFSDGVPGYAFKRYLGDKVTESMGPRDRKWICDQVMEIEVPEMLKALNKGIGDLADPEKIDWET
jgi:hypothetical protein